MSNNYLIGNEDMHLKNYSLITRKNLIELVPAYDFINTTIAAGIDHVKEEIALPINSKKNNLTRKDIIDYYGRERLGINSEVMRQILNEFKDLIPIWFGIIGRSFLSDSYKKDYALIVDSRCKIVQI